MAISKEQPMRPALIEAVDSIDEANDAALNALNIANDAKSDVQNEITRATAAEANLQTAIENETDERISAVNELEQSISSTENFLLSNIDAEEARATTAEANLQTAIEVAVETEKTRAEAAETTLQTAIDNEAARATAAENALQEQIQPQFRLQDFGYSLNPSITLNPITNDAAPGTNLNRIDITIDSALENEWKIASLAKYELKSGSTRIDATVLYSFSMNAQKTLRVGFKTTGTQDVQIDYIAGALLLMRR